MTGPSNIDPTDQAGSALNRSIATWLTASAPTKAVPSRTDAVASDVSRTVSSSSMASSNRTSTSACIRHLSGLDHRR